MSDRAPDMRKLQPLFVFPGATLSGVAPKMLLANSAVLPQARFRGLAHQCALSTYAAPGTVNLPEGIRQQHHRRAKVEIREVAQ